MDTYSYTEDTGSFYLSIGALGSSSIAYTKPRRLANANIIPNTNIDFRLDDESDKALTRNAMNLSESSLAEDWKDEDDDYWKSLL